MSGEDPLEEGTATHSNILAWRSPVNRGACRLQSMELQRVRHDWVTKCSTQHRDIKVNFWKVGNRGFLKFSKIHKIHTKVYIYIYMYIYIYIYTHTHTHVHTHIHVGIYIYKVYLSWYILGSIIGYYLSKFLWPFFFFVSFSFFDLFCLFSLSLLLFFLFVFILDNLYWTGLKATGTLYIYIHIYIK